MRTKASKIFLGGIQDPQSQEQAQKMLRQGDVNMLEMIVVYAHWCPICNMMMPIVEEIETDSADKVSITWIDVEKSPEAIEQYGIEIVPTYILMRKQVEVARMAGMIGEQVLRKRIDDEDGL